ncbi:class I SAM-dependent methyltransferase [Microbacter sp. GSS18]|nr:class I SAM-dependent methyltransferase [Microbacter sp. GSS18]
MAGREELSRSFGAVADVYESGRPEYPSEAVAWLLEPVRREGRVLRVADVGAGTGKLTRVAVEFGAQVVAVDPDPAMLAALREQVIGVPTFVGSAESMPLPDHSLDALLYGQAWHWVEPGAASAEAARVLRAGGVLGLIWNVRDERELWVRRLNAVMKGSRAEQMLAAGDPPVAAPFDGVEHARWSWRRAMTRDELFALARSRSHVITASESERARIEDGLELLLDEVGAVGDDPVELPYVTHAYRAVRP